MDLRYGKYVFTPIIVLFLSSAVTAYAHTTGASWNVRNGAYTIDVGYDPVTFAAGHYARFDLLLWRGESNTGEPADFSQVWVRIVRDPRETVLATGIQKQPVGPTTLLYEFSETGTYALEVSYRDKNGDDIAVGSFPIEVQPDPTRYSENMKFVIALVSGLVLGGITWAIVAPRLRKIRSS